jgi:hypothetical protein
MVFSIFVVVTSYLHCGIRLFDPGAGISLPRAKDYAQVLASQTLDCAVHHVLRIVHVLSRLLRYLRVNAARDHLRNDRWWRRVTIGQCVYWGLRMGLEAGCVVGTLFVSLEAAGSDPLSDSL